MKKITIIFLLGWLIVSCDVPTEGFFSHEGIRMQEDTVEIIKGLYQLTGIPAVDGSTRPLNFELVGIRNLRSGQMVDFGVYEINMWTSAFNPDIDTTMSIVNQKLIKRAVPPIEINPYSGQFAFNSGTRNLDGDLFGVDVKCSNKASSDLFENFCVFKLISQPFTVQVDFGDAFNGIPATGEAGRVGLTASTATYTAADKELIQKNLHPNRKLTKIADSDVMKLIMVVKDSEGKTLSPKSIIFWPSGTSYLNNYHDNSIAMEGSTEKVQYTDTSCVFTFPTVPYPSYGRTYASGDNLYLSYYCIDKDYYVPTAAAQKLYDDYERANNVTFVTYSARFRNGYKINETGVWLMVIKHPYILKK